MRKSFKRHSRRNSRKRSGRRVSIGKVLVGAESRSDLTKDVRALDNKVKKLDRARDPKFVMPYNFTYAGASLTSTLTNSNAQCVLINGMQRGTSYNTRIADIAVMNSVKIAGQLFFSGGGTTAGINAAVRIMLVRMLRPRGAAMVLQGSSTSAGTTQLFWTTGLATTWSLTDTGVGTAAYRSYKVLYDKTHRLVTQVGYWNGGAANSVNPYVNFHINKRLGFTSDYSRGNAGTYADFEKNSLWLVFITDTNSNIVVQTDVKTYFADS